MFYIAGSIGNTLEVQYFETPVHASFTLAHTTLIIILDIKNRKACDPADDGKKTRFHSINLQWRTP